MKTRTDYGIPAGRSRAMRPRPGFYRTRFSPDHCPMRRPASPLLKFCHPDRRLWSAKRIVTAVEGPRIPIPKAHPPSPVRLARPPKLSFRRASEARLEEPARYSSRPPLTQPRIILHHQVGHFPLYLRRPPPSRIPRALRRQPPPRTPAHPLRGVDRG